MYPLGEDNATNISWFQLLEGIFQCAQVGIYLYISFKKAHVKERVSSLFQREDS